jgi:hypothetical protein
MGYFVAGKLLRPCALGWQLGDEAAHQGLCSPPPNCSLKWQLALSLWLVSFLKERPLSSTAPARRAGSFSLLGRVAMRATVIGRDRTGPCVLGPRREGGQADRRQGEGPACGRAPLTAQRLEGPVGPRRGQWLTKRLGLRDCPHLLLAKGLGGAVRSCSRASMCWRAAREARVPVIPAPREVAWSVTAAARRLNHLLGNAFLGAMTYREHGLVASGPWFSGPRPGNGLRRP